MNMPELIHKPDMLKNLDRALATHGADILNDLIAGGDLATLGRNYAVFTDAEEKHVRTHWFGDKWWHHIPALVRESIVREGLIEAIKTARDKKVSRFDSYWVCHPGHKQGGAAAGDGAAVSVDDHAASTDNKPPEFEVSVCWGGGDQVILTLHTPDPEVRDQPPVKGEPIKIVKLAQDGSGKIVTVDQETGKVKVHPPRARLSLEASEEARRASQPRAAP
jgi:hypothetical protein